MKISDEHKKKISESMKGKPKSEAHKKALSEARILRRQQKIEEMMERIVSHL